MIGYYNYTVILTYIGALSGLAGIAYIGSGQLKTALICLMLSGFCDMFDGKIASTMERSRQEKRFGVQIDSLSDLVCFGVLPALIGLHCSRCNLAAMLICASYALCALIRLAWFNVDEEERQDREEGCRSFYLGLPVTCSALLLPLFIGAAGLLSLNLERLVPGLLLILAAAFITPMHLKKPGLPGLLAMSLLGIATLVLVFTEVAV